MKVYVKNNNIEFALKKFKRKVKNSGLLLELKERQYYEKPSAIRRRKKAKAIARERYNRLRENESPNNSKKNRRK
tara:strand:+ start:404 stop:628 length:225 start_codon:yes stop_codon:yes gene_type:complete